MKVLFVTTGYPERGKPTTGFPNYLYRVSLALVQMGHKSVILAAGGRQGHRTEQGIDIWTVKVETINCKSQTLRYIINALKKGYSLNRKLKEILKKESIDIIQFTSLEGIAMFYRGNIPAILRLSSYAKIAFASFQSYSRIKVKVMSFIERISSRRCNVVFAPSKNTAEAYGKDCNRNVRVIESPFINDVKVYDNKYVDQYLKDKKYALFFGTFYIEKGILVIAEILHKFLQCNPQYYFVFIGSADYANSEEYINLLVKNAGEYRDRVIIWDALPHPQLYPIIMKADFVVLPSLMENLSNACIEAMYFEKVVIGTDGASFEQLITHGENGLLCRIGDSKDLYEKMQMAASMSVVQKEKMGERAKARIDKLKPEYAVKRLLHLYEYTIKYSRS